MSVIFAARYLLAFVSRVIRTFYLNVCLIEIMSAETEWNLCTSLLVDQ